MDTGLGRFLHWAPRVLAILFAVFLSLFALDVLGMGASFWETLLGLLVHLVPVYLVIIALVVAWRWECAGATLFAALAAFYIIWAWGAFVWTAYAIVSGPPLLIAVLFLLSCLYKRQHRIP